MRRLLTAAFLFTTLSFAQSLTGLWDATVTVSDFRVPFRMEFTNDAAIFFNGDEKVISTSGLFNGKSGSFRFEHYAGTLSLELFAGKLTGKYDRGSRGIYAFEAKRFVPSPLDATEVPSIAGIWEIGGVASSKGENAWTLIVRQAGAEVSAAIQRIDGDTGELSGTYRDGKFTISHFSGARPSVFELKPAADGSLAVTQNGKQTWTALRSKVARAKGLPEPTDPSKHTTVKDPTVPFTFAGKDLSGKLTTNEDPRFQGKVVIVAVGGSWCPNCHDEAPFLMDLYRKYHAKGLEIVGLSFEEAEQIKDLSRLRFFVRQYGIEYPILVAGEPGEWLEKLPQAVNLNSWPTSFILGRDGRVRSVHAGFAGKATGALHAEMVEEVEATLQRLLSEELRTSRE